MTKVSQYDRDHRLRDKIPIKISIVFGIAAYLTAYAVTYALTAVAASSSFGYKSVGLTFYNAHFAQVKITSPDGRSILMNFLSEAGDTIPEPVWYLVPIALLLIAGFITAKKVHQRHRSISIGVLSGAAVTTGYLVLSVLGLVIFRVTTEGVTANPDPVPAIMYAGITFPVIFGGLGGLLAMLTSKQEEPPAEAYQQTNG